MRNSDWVLLFLRRAHRPVHRDAAQAWRDIFLRHARATEAQQRAPLEVSQEVEAHQQEVARHEFQREQRQSGQRRPEDD